MQENLLRHRPAVLVALSMIAGSVAVERGWLSEPGALLALGTAAIAALIGFRYRAALLVAGVIGIASLSALSVMRSRSCESSDFARIAALRPQNVVVTGTLAQVDPLQHGYRWVVIVDSLALQQSDNSTRHAVPVRARLLVWASVDRAALRAVNMPLWKLPRSGDRLRVFTSLAAIHDATNPYEFNRERTLQRELEVDASSEIHSVFDYTILRRHTSRLDLVESYLSDVRGYIDARLDEAIRDARSRAFVKAVVLGEREDMDHATYEDFTKAGIAHILAVSGFNVAIVAGVVAQLLRLLGIYRLRVRTVLVMLAVLLYSAVVGFQPSVVRALVMIELYYLAMLLERRRDPLNVIAVAAVLNLLVRPNDLFDVGFQLTYVSVIGLALVAPELQRLLIPERWRSHKWLRKPFDVLILSSAAALASAPVLIVHFHRVSLAGLLTNLPAIPLSSAITALGFLLVPITAVSQALGALYGDAVTLLTNALLLTTSKAASLPSASRPIAEPLWYWIAAFVLAFVYLLRSADRARFRARLSIVAAAVVCVYASGVRLSQSPVASEAKLSVLFSDVGQGDCIFLKTPHGRNYVIDCGTISRHNVARAEEALLPLLRSESNTNIDAIFLSHMHRDHYGGAPALLDNCNVSAVYTSGERVRDPVAYALDSIALVQHTQLRVLERGARLVLDSGVVLYVLHPGAEAACRFKTAYGSHANSGSLAFKICYGRTSFLFLGDVERSDEELMKDEYGHFLKSSVVKVAHHGSLTSSSRLFGMNVDPKWAVISVGDDNRFGHPAPAIVRRWSAIGAHVARTDHDGAVLIESNGSEVRRVNWRER